MPAHAHAHAHGHAHAHPVHVHPKPEVIPVAPTPVVVEEPVEEALSEASLEVVGEVFHGDAEDPYVEYDVVVEESESSESSEHTHESVDHYAAAAPEESSEETVVELVQPDPTTAPKVVATKVGGRVYRPEPTLRAPVLQHTSNLLPEGIEINHIGGGGKAGAYDQDGDVVINIFNNGAPAFGKQLEYDCKPKAGECRPQCPEARFDSRARTVTISFLEDAAGCPHYAKPEGTLVTLFAPSQHGYSFADDLDGKTVTELPGSVCPAGGLVLPVDQVLDSGVPLECDTRYYISGMYTWTDHGHKKYGAPNTSANSLWIPCAW